MGVVKAIRAVPAVGGGCLWILIWTAGTLFVDFITVRNTLSQMGTSRYLPVEGRVCKVWSEGGGEDATYRIEYRYTVHDHEYLGTRYRRGDGAHAGSATSAGIAGMSAGQAVTVYYDPDRPGNAALRQGLQGEDLFLFLFLVPFNAVMLGSWVFGLRAAVRRAGPGPAGWPCRREGAVTRAQTAGLSPWLGAGLALAGSAFILIFVLGLPFGFDPPLGLMTGAWAGILAAAVVVFLTISQRVRTGRYDLVLDAGTLTLPAGGGRTEPREVGRAAVETVTVKEKDEKHVAQLVWRDSDGKLQVDMLLEGHGPEETERFAAWLLGELGRPTA